MSLPSKVKFFKDGKEVLETFINCGWVCNEDSVIRSIKDTIHRERVTKDWDTVEAYGYGFSKAYVFSYKSIANRKFDLEIDSKGNDITIPKIENNFPQILAENIVNVQPMNADCGEVFKMRYLTENLRMYFLVLDWVDIGHAMNSMAHAGCMIPLHWSDDDPIMKEWYGSSIRKVTCKVTPKQFEKAKEYDDWFVVTEKQFDDKEVALVFKPRREWDKFFKFLTLYK